MKSIPLIALLIFTNIIHAETTAPTAEAFYQQGQAAEKAGDPTAARDFYQKALKLDPKNANVIYSMGQLKLTAGSIATKGREAKFGTVMIPTYQLDAASLRDALDALSTIMEKQSKEEVVPNFVIVDPKGLFESKKITLNVKGVTSQAALKYVMDQTSAKARFDEHAVVISPL
jgi:tetratricopeptide (TPR) repeat protein